MGHRGQRRHGRSHRRRSHPRDLRLRIALCEAGELTPDRDAGSRAVADLIAGCRFLGHEVRLFSEVHQNITARVTEFAPDLVILSRPGLFMRLFPQMKPLGVPIVYLASDLHFVRVGLQADVTGSESNPAAVMKLIEEQCFRRADLSLVPTRQEEALVRAEFDEVAVRTINYFFMPEHPLPTEPADYRIAFVGGPLHAPNRDGVEWFVENLWPGILAQHSAAEFVICGSWEREAAAFAGVPGLRFPGSLTDKELDATLSSARIGIAPLRFGAGMKRKTLHYLSLGLPVIGTDFAVEGLTDDRGETPGVLRANTADEWVAAHRDLDDPLLWSTTSMAGWNFVRDRFSEARYRDDLSAALDSLG